jgi:flagellar biosynthetic protein FliO
MGVPEAELPGLGSSIALSLVSLALVLSIAYLALRWLGRKGLVGNRSTLIRVLGRCTLEPRKSIYLVESAGRCFLIGVGDGPIGLLAEIDRESLPVPSPTIDPSSGSGIGEWLKHFLAKGRR